MYPLEVPRVTPIRKIRIVVDLEDPMTPALTIKEFLKVFGKEPRPPRYRVLTVEVLRCPEDDEVVLVSECAECPRFLRRSGDHIVCLPSKIRAY